MAVNRAKYSLTSCPDTEPVDTSGSPVSTRTPNESNILRVKLTACTCFGSRRQRSLQKKWRRLTWGKKGKDRRSYSVLQGGCTGVNEPQLSFTNCIYVRFRKKQLRWQVSTGMPQHVTLWDMRRKATTPKSQGMERRPPQFTAAHGSSSRSRIRRHPTP